jgi:hypothetical protein
MGGTGVAVAAGRAAADAEEEEEATAEEEEALVSSTAAAAAAAVAGNCFSSGSTKPVAERRGAAAAEPVADDGTGSLVLPAAIRSIAISAAPTAAPAAEIEGRGGTGSGLSIHHISPSTAPLTSKGRRRTCWLLWSRHRAV